MFTGIRNKPDSTLESVVQVVQKVLVAGFLSLFPGMDLKKEDKLLVVLQMKLLLENFSLLCTLDF